MYTSTEGEAQVCVSLQNGTLQTGTVIRYIISVTSTGKFPKSLFVCYLTKGQGFQINTDNNQLGVCHNFRSTICGGRCD